MKLPHSITIDGSEIEMSAIRSGGAGGQNVNKVSTAIHLRFDIHASSLPEPYRSRLLALKDKRISSQGVVIIKAQKHRTQEKNRADALERLKSLLESVMHTRKKRIPTRPTRASRQRRLDDKSRRSQVKKLRKPIID